MDFHKVRFKAAYGTVDQLPPSQLPEVSFAGRSNVGKSSLLNRLMYRKNLAKVSQVPGKTSTINFYEVDGCDLVDLPGYGFAQVSKAEKNRWADLIEGYFNQDRDFALVVALMDIRHDPSDLDFGMVEFLQDAEIPFCVVLTKADKLSNQQVNRQRAHIKKLLGLSGSQRVSAGLDGDDASCGSRDGSSGGDAAQSIKADVPVLAVSAEKGRGIDELRSMIASAVS